MLVIALGWTAFLMISGFTGLTNDSRSDIREITVISAHEVSTADVKLFNAIPIFRERFYLCESEDGVVPYLVKGRTSWFNKNFDEHGRANKPVTMTCEVAYLDKELSRAPENIDEGLSRFEFLLSSYKTKYILRIIAGAVIVASAAVLLIARGREPGKKIGVILGFAALAFSMFAMLLGDKI